MSRGMGAAMTRLFLAAVSHPMLSRLTGRLADLRLPRALLRPLLRIYVRAFGVDLAEAAGPVECYPTFNAFFTRRLKEGARPVATDPGVVVSPSDSWLRRVGTVPADGTLEQVKGLSYTLGGLLGSEEDALPFRQGVYAALYLSPAMYHRVHSPVEGLVRAWRYVPGRLFPVWGASVRSVPGLFTRNERVALFLETVAHGAVAVVLVGAANVGRIRLAFTDLVTNAGAPATGFRSPDGVAVRRGQEIGVFNLGSTVIVLAADPTLAPAGVSAGDVVRVGQALWRRP
jgi:phosphatidylserine decarboxylase